MKELNPYYYSKFLFEKVSPIKGIKYLNSYFFERFQRNAFGGLELWTDTVGSKGEAHNSSFISRLSYITQNSPNGFLPPHLNINYGLFFQELWKWAPNWELFTIINLGKPILTSAHHANSSEIILNTLLESMEEGWITFSGKDYELQRLPAAYSGRLCLDTLDLSIDYYEKLGEELTEVFIRKGYEIEEKSSFVDPEVFWASQSETNAHKVAQQFIHTLFKFYGRTISQLNRDMKLIKAFSPFVEAARKAFHKVIEEPVEITDFYPRYAGFSGVKDSKEWIRTLMMVLDGEADLSHLDPSV